jgi:hypothetical protein
VLDTLPSGQCIKELGRKLVRIFHSCERIVDVLHISGEA